MAIADTNLGEVRLVEEVTWNTNPGTDMVELPVVSESLGYDIATAVSNTIRSDRQVPDLVQTSAQSGGDLAFEVNYGTLDPIMEGAMFNDWSTTVAVSAADISAAAADNSYNSVTTDFTTENISVGQWIKVAGFTGNTANNGFAKVVSVAANKIVVSNITLVDDASGETVTMAGSMLRNGTTRKSYSMEVEYTDISEFKHFRGMMVSSFNLACASGAIVTAGASFLGAYHASAQTTSGTGTVTAANSNPYFNGVSNVANVEEAGSDLAAGVFIRSIDFAIDNGLRAQNAIGSLDPIGVGTGRCNVTGNAEFFFANDDMYAKYIAGQATSFSWRLTDANGASYVITLPNVKFTAAPHNLSGIDADIVIPMAFQALRDATTDCSIQIDKFAA